MLTIPSPPTIPSPDDSIFIFGRPIAVADAINRYLAYGVPVTYHDQSNGACIKLRPAIVMKTIFVTPADTGTDLQTAKETAYRLCDLYWNVVEAQN